MEMENLSRNVIESTKLFNSATYTIMSLLIIAFIIFLVISWVFYTLSKKDSACRKLTQIYKNNERYKTRSLFSNAMTTDNLKNYFHNPYHCLMKSYYIKTAYNACCGDGYKNNFVNICALEKCIEYGARCLDFEIYSYNGEPIVAASTANNNSIKETYNYIKLTDVLDVLRNRSFRGEFTNCSDDPMFLHFRIMSENKEIYDKFGDYIQRHLIGNNSDIILDTTQYNYRNNNNFLLEHIGVDVVDDNNNIKKKFQKKFIIMVHTLHGSILSNSKLADYVHLRSGTSTLKCLRYEQLVAAGKKNQLLIDDSNRNLIIVLPNINNKLDNYDAMLPISNGCQFIAMKFQNLDNNLRQYFTMFNNYGNRSFVLKPNHLRINLIPPEDPQEGVTLNEITNNGFRMPG